MKPKHVKRRPQKGTGEIKIVNEYDNLSDEEIIDLYSDVTPVLPNMVVICRQIGERKTVGSGLYLPTGLALPAGSMPSEPRGQNIRAHEPTPQIPCLVVGLSDQMDEDTDIKVGDFVLITNHAPNMAQWDLTRRGYSAVLIPVSALACKVDLDSYWEHNVDPLAEKDEEIIDNPSPIIGEA